MAYNEKVFAIGRIFIERPARTNASLKLFVEDNICSVTINVKLELLLSKDLLPIVLPSSPAIANTHVSCSCHSFLRFDSVVVIHLETTPKQLDSINLLIISEV